jgi:hypothetical protein
VKLHRVGLSISELAREFSLTLWSSALWRGKLIAMLFRWDGGLSTSVWEELVCLRRENMRTDKSHRLVCAGDDETTRSSEWNELRDGLVGRCAARAVTARQSRETR